MRVRPTLRRIATLQVAFDTQTTVRCALRFKRPCDWHASECATIGTAECFADEEPHLP